MTENDINQKRGKGSLWLIPSPLGENAPEEVIPEPVLQSLRHFTTFVVEEVRTARRYLSRAGLKGKIQELRFHELNEHTGREQIESYLELFNDGNDVALISEAGLPAVADPGAQLVALAHRHGIRVIPAVGPSSLMLALMASGLNGQSFAFCGYLPAKSEERKNRLRAIEKLSSTPDFILRKSMIFLCLTIPYHKAQEASAPPAVPMAYLNLKEWNSMHATAVCRMKRKFPTCSRWISGRSWT